MTGNDSLRRDLLARTLFEVLRDAPGPLAPKDALVTVEQRLDLTDHERSRNRRFDTYLRWLSSWASTVGWMAKRGGWTITEPGAEAMVEHDRLGLEVLRRYLRRRKNNATTQGYTDPRWVQVADALAVVEAGWWTTYGDLAELAGLAAPDVGTFIAKEPIPHAYRVLRADGLIAPGFTWNDPTRTGDPRTLLEQEGLTFDNTGHADPAQRMTAETLREALGDSIAAETSPTRRAWLVRGSSVDGRDLVPVWLQRGSVSLAAANLRPITGPLDARALQAVVDEDYAHKSYAARGTKLGEFDAFLNLMRPGDHVLTTSQGKVYLGEITGDAEYTTSSDNRSNLRRPVRWHVTRGVVYAKLPAPLPARFAGQADVVNLTDDVAAVDSLLAALGVTDPTPEPQRELAFPDVTDELARELFVGREWLQEQANLLWDCKQVVLYGPPGTGKTYLARELAAHLVRDPGAVKLVQFHPSYTYEDFFEGFRPVPRDDGQLAFTLHPGPFRRLVEAARQHRSDPYVLIIDEINRANLAAVFGELYFLLEYCDHQIELLYSDAEFTLPPNVFMIGTMNTADRSIALLDAAMRRRFAFVELHPSQEPTAGLLAAWLERLTESGQEVTENLDAPRLLDALNARIGERDLAIGPSYLMRPSIYRKAEALERVWATSILPLLAEYHYGSGPDALDPYRLDALRSALGPAPGDTAPGGDPAP